VGLLDRLAEQWSIDRGYRARADDLGLVIEEWDGTPLHPIVEVRMDEESLARFTASLDADDLREVWPGRAPEWIAGAVLWTRLDELLSFEVRPRTLALEASGLVEVRPG
jgi:hypothetical protein